MSKSQDLQAVHDQVFRHARMIQSKEDRFGFLREQIIQFEKYWNPSERAHLVKKMAATFLKVYNADEAFRSDVRMLDIWWLLGKYSQEIGMGGVLEKIDQTGSFAAVPEFYVMWARHLREEQRLEALETVVEKCRQRCGFTERQIHNLFGQKELPREETGSVFMDAAPRYDDNGPEPEAELDESLPVQDISVFVDEDAVPIFPRRVLRMEPLDIAPPKARRHAASAAAQQQQFAAPAAPQQQNIDAGAAPQFKEPAAPQQKTIEAVAAPQQKAAEAVAAPPQKSADAVAAPQQKTTAAVASMEDDGFGLDEGDQKENDDELDPFSSPCVKKPRDTKPPRSFATLAGQQPPQEKTNAVPKEPLPRSPTAPFPTGDEPTLAGTGKPAAHGETSTPNKGAQPARPNFTLDDTGTVVFDAALMTDEELETQAKYEAYLEQREIQAQIEALEADVPREKPIPLIGGGPYPGEGLLARRLSKPRHELDKLQAQEAAQKTTTVADKAKKTTADIENRLRDIHLGPPSAEGPQHEKEDAPDPFNETTGRGDVIETIKGDVNPWDPKLRADILRHALMITYKHDFNETCPKIDVRKKVDLGGELFDVHALIGQGGFAKVFRATSTEDGKQYAVKYEIPSCPWEVYICDTLQRRIREHMKSFVMTIRDAYIFTNASAIVYDFYPYGTLLDLSNRYKQQQMEMDGLMVALLGTQIASILEEIHRADIIHADVKPDNFVITGPIPERTVVNDLLKRPLVKLIDWGRAIDMRHHRGRVFVGRAGTQCFDCIEMVTDQPWTYQTDFYGFCATVHVLMFNDYLKTSKLNADGLYAPVKAIKRRLPLREMWIDVFRRCLNVESCNNLPNWLKINSTMRRELRDGAEHDPQAWNAGIQRLNAVLAQQNVVGVPVPK